MYPVSLEKAARRRALTYRPQGLSAWPGKGIDGLSDRHHTLHSLRGMPRK